MSSLRPADSVSACCLGFCLITLAASLCNRNKFVLIFQWLKDDLKYRSLKKKQPFYLTPPTGLNVSPILRHPWFVAQIYIFSCSFSSLGQLWRNYYLCSIWFFYGLHWNSLITHNPFEIGPLPRIAERIFLMKSH